MRLASLFCDHAVLQRDQPIPVWGTAAPNGQVTVTLAGHTARVIANAQGTWLVRFPALPTGGPYELTAESDSGRAVAHDILIGEVWVCAGQSNMEMRLGQTLPLDEVALAPLPQVRLFSVSNPARVIRQQEAHGCWVSADSEALRNFSAVGGWFAREVHKELNVPIGLIGMAWGGSRIEAWTSREALVQDPVIRHEVQKYEDHVFSPERPKEETFANFADWERRGAPQDSDNRGLKEGWADSNFNDAAWQIMQLPSRWQYAGHPENGIFWFRRNVTIPSDWAGKDLELHLGAADKHDDTWVNGVHVGGLSWENGPEAWATPRVYPVPGHLIKGDGQVCIAVRVRSHVYHGGLTGPEDEMYLVPAGTKKSDKLSLVGKWRYAIEQNWGVVTPPVLWGTGGEGDHNTPAILFDSRVFPILPYGIRGVLWYQGESNAFKPEEYRRLLPAMIRDWRRAWGQGDFPFLQVQLANYMPFSPTPSRSDWAELRDAQAAALTDANVGMAVAIDIGDAKDIHPRDKRSVGLRLARWALAETYGRGGLPSGPLYAGFTTAAGGRIRIRLRYASGLRTRDGGPPKHIAIAGNDKKFHWAESKIEGECLVVWHPQIPLPLSVRYAWADNPEGCNLVNADGFPASPFRTDNW
jgi:sialate O-acetylesterase